MKLLQDSKPVYMRNEGGEGKDAFYCSLIRHFIN